MTLPELSSSSDQNKETIRMEGEIIDPVEHYLRLYAEDTDEADVFLEAVIDDPQKRTLIRLDAGLIAIKITRQRSSGKVNMEKIEKAVEEYKSDFSDALREQSDK